MVQISDLEIISGLSGIVGVLFTYILGALMIGKYLRYKERSLLLMGIIMILISQPWMPFGISVILILTTGEYLPLRLHILIGHSLQPLGILLWMTAMSKLLWEKKQRLVIFIFAVFATIYETVVLYTIFIDPSIFVIEERPLDYRYLSLFLLCTIIALLVGIITSVLFFLQSQKSPQSEIRLKGTLFIISIFSYTTGAILDSVLLLSLLLLVIVRTLLLSSSVEIYMAFAMPKWVKKRILKEE